MLNKSWIRINKNKLEFLILILAIIFSSWLMFSTFSSTPNSLNISSKAWSDFSGHIPLIRSFSMGSNIPPEYPLFPGEAIKYHFVFYAFAGILEKIGLPIGFALNVPSIIGFTLLIFIIYFFGKSLFKSKTVGIISVVLFLFNSSLSFIYYFKNNPISFQAIINIPKIDNFQSFAPYDGGIIAAFWNLNIYTNQRHLALSLAISLAIILFLIFPIFSKYKNKIFYTLIVGAILGLTFYLHLAVLLMTSIVILCLGLMFSKIRRDAFIILTTAAIFALPQYSYLSTSEGYKPFLNPGFLIANDFTIFKFVQFWTYNLGLSLILIPLGFIFSNIKQKKVLLSFIPILIVGNLFQFSPEIAANHKFFNYFLLIGNMFSAYALIILWNKNNFIKPIVVLLFFFLIFGGIIDFFPLWNDHKISINDYKINPNAQWIKNNTSPNAIFLNTTYLYNSASLVGRKIFLGWPYFPWSQGYDTEARGQIVKNILGASNKSYACQLLKENHIDYIEIKFREIPDPDVASISDIYQNKFTKQYFNPLENYSIYSVYTNCP